MEEENAQLRQELEALQAELARRKDSDDPPPFVKPRRQVAEPKPPGHEGATRAKPEQVDEERELKLQECPDCGTPLGDPAEVRERYAWDLAPPRAHIIGYRIARYRCPKCRRLVEQKPGDVLPDHRLSVRAITAVVYRRQGLRLPVKQVQQLLVDAGLQLSGGTIEQVCTEVAAQLRPRYETILAAARSRGGGNG